MKRPLKKSEQQQLVQWAKRNVRGLDDSAAFVAIMNHGPLNAERVEFTLQLGHCILHDKPILVALPHGQPVPDKLQKVADRIIRYDPADMKSIQPGLAQALAELGINKQ